MSRKSARKDNSTSDMKGRLVEELVATMHEYPGVTVQQRARLPGLHDVGTKREIDVLLTSTIAGYAVGVAVECKNERKPIGVQSIDAFIGKLQHVGIPVQHGVFVSASGYTKVAVERALACGLRLLTLTGLTSDRLTSAVLDAFGSVLYLLCDILEMEVILHDGTSIVRTPAQGLFVFCDETRQVDGYLPDLVYEAWLNGDVPTDVGTHQLMLQAPENWQWLVNERASSLEPKVLKPVRQLRTTARIIGFMAMLKGTAVKHTLVNALTEEIEKQHVEPQFELPASTPVTGFYSEKDLADFFQERTEEVRQDLGRFRLPRIKYGGMYWPPSARVAAALDAHGRAAASGQPLEPDVPSALELEGSDLSVINEPLWAGHPAIQKGRWELR
ncbi:MAG: restriction endonuclease [Chloroflexota bacterium]|nr:restriction endonuclease [Chloroflexota bacterium]MDQ5865165.1 restriction endonuclease [Chloroflexota bacterium]